jgi:thiamine-phosphate pyrophosphorylase
VSPADLRLCLVTDRHATRERPLDEVVEACLRAGLRAVQLREKDLAAGALLDLAQRLRELTRRAGARLLVNDRVDVVLAVGADGVHLPGASLSVDVARRLVGPARLVGVSTHSPPEAEAAGRAGADYVVFGPVYDTPSKRPYGAPPGLPALGEACRSARVPVLAIGGITPARVAEVRRAGAAGVAVIRGLLDTEDPAGATCAFLDAWESGGP